MTKVDIAQRHRGSLQGKLSGNQRLPAKVQLNVEAAVATRPAVQHLCWMLSNLLARQADEIAALQFAIPPGVRLATRLGPLVEQQDVDLVVALRGGVSRINPAVLGEGRNARSRVSIRIGPGALGDGDLVLATSAHGWAGYVGRQSTDIVGDEDNPIGSYIAACLTAAEVFKFVRGVRATDSTPAVSLWLDGTTFQISSAPSECVPLPAKIDLRPAVIVGAGAVGNSLLHLLYALPQARGSLTLIDKDEEGITDTNLNRCVLFGLDQVGLPKASIAAAAFAASAIAVEPVDGSWESWYAARDAATIDLVISAVDTNRARHAIQDALPRLILGGSTNEMRAQINAYDPLAGGPCLRCRNRPEASPTDKDLIDQLRQLPADERHARAAQIGVEPTDLELFLSDPIVHCGKVSGTTLKKFAESAVTEEWSVGFVSAFAGTLLAAEYVQLSIPSAQPALMDGFNTYPFQFWHPAKSAVNRLTWTPPEPGCVCQSSAFCDAMKAVWNTGHQ